MSTMNSLPTSSSATGENMFSLKWNHYHSYLTTGLAKLLEDDYMTDVILGCEGQFIQAHRLVLSVCSPFFKEYFKTYCMEKTGGLIVLANVRFKDLKNLMQFIYHGQVNVSNADLTSFLKTAKDLKIEGLADGADQGNTASPTLGSTENINPSTSATESVASPRLPVSTPSYSHTTTSSNSGAPEIKRSRLSIGQSSSVPTTTTTANVQTSSFSSASLSLTKSDLCAPALNQHERATTSVPLPHSSNYDPLDMEDEQEEEMINLDEVKPEPIAIYTLNDEEGEESMDHHGDDSLPEGLGNDSGGIVYHDYESHLNQPPGPGPSSANLHPAHRMQSSGPNPRTVVNKPAVVAGEESLDNSGSVFHELIDTFKMKCKQCGDNVASDQYQMHKCLSSQNVQTGTFEPVICPHCGKTFKNKNSLKVHKSTYHRFSRSKISSGTRLNSLVDNNMEFTSTMISQPQQIMSAPFPQSKFIQDQKHSIRALADFESGAELFPKVKVEQPNTSQQLRNSRDTSNSEPVLQLIAPFADQPMVSMVPLPLHQQRPQHVPPVPLCFGDMDALDTLRLRGKKPDT